MKDIGFSTWAFPTRSVDYSIDFALEESFTALEIALLGPGLFGELLIPSATQSALVEKRTSDLRLTVHAPVDQIYLADDDPHVRAESAIVLRRVLDAAQLMGAETVVCHLYRRTYTEGNAQSVDTRGQGYAIDLLSQIGEEVQDSGITIAIENKGYSARSADRNYAGLKDLVNAIQLANIGIAFDIGHAHVHRNQGGGIEPSLRLFEKNVRHFHIHDNHGTSDDHLAVGIGSIDYSSLIPTWRSKSGQILMMEVFNAPNTDIKSAIIASRQALVEIIN